MHSETVEAAPVSVEQKSLAQGDVNASVGTPSQKLEVSNSEMMGFAGARAGASVEASQKLAENGIVSNFQFVDADGKALDAKAMEELNRTYNAPVMSSKPPQGSESTSKSFPDKWDGQQRDGRETPSRSEDYKASPWIKDLYDDQKRFKEMRK